MNFLACLSFGVVNGLMILTCLFGKRGRVYEFPFWIGLIGMGWFYPMAIANYSNTEYPEGAYAAAMFFATLCSLGVWIGFNLSVKARPERPCWLDASYDFDKLVLAGMVLSVLGFYFEYKLSTLPEELFSSQWSGAPVKYLFFASLFKIGFMMLWLVYLRQQKIVVPKMLLFLVPGFLMMLETAFVGGRRGAMMELVAYVLVALWFVRRFALPRWALLMGGAAGLILVNSIGLYRNIMAQAELPLMERIRIVLNTDFLNRSDDAKDDGKAHDFDNFVYYRKVIGEEGKYDFGLAHWNGFVWNYVPGQIIGQSNKRALMVKQFRPQSLAQQRYGHRFFTGSVSTGYTDAFASFGWFGFINFVLIGWMMGVLYRHAMCGKLLSQLLYCYMLNKGMHSVSHGTGQVLVTQWVYFLALGYPAMIWARLPAELSGSESQYPEGYPVEGKVE